MALLFRAALIRYIEGMPTYAFECHGCFGEFASRQMLYMFCVKGFLICRWLSPPCIWITFSWRMFTFGLRKLVWWMGRNKETKLAWMQTFPAVRLCLCVLKSASSGNSFLTQTLLHFETCGVLDQRCARKRFNLSRTSWYQFGSFSASQGH